MSLFAGRNLGCLMMIVVLPVSIAAQESGRAILRNDAGVWLNGNSAPASTAIFVHDTIQTRESQTAKIDAEGSTVTIQPETLVTFDGDELALDHGSLQLVTSREMKVRVGCLTVIPISAEWTRYDVIDVDGKVTVTAFQNDVKIHSAGAVAKQSKKEALADEIVHQGEQKSRDEHCGAAEKPSDAIDAKAAILNSTWAKIAGGTAIALTCILICRSDDPISPDKP